MGLSPPSALSVIITALGTSGRDLNTAFDRLRTSVVIPSR